MNDQELMVAFPHGCEVEWGLLDQRTRVIGWDAPDVLVYTLGSDAERVHPEHLTRIEAVKPVLVSDNESPLVGVWAGDDAVEFMGERTVVYENPTALVKRDGEWAALVCRDTPSLSLVAGQLYIVTVGPAIEVAP